MILDVADPRVALACAGALLVVAGAGLFRLGAVRRRSDEPTAVVGATVAVARLRELTAPGAAVTAAGLAYSAAVVRSASQPARPSTNPPPRAEPPRRILSHVTTGSGRVVYLPDGTVERTERPMGAQ